MRLKYDKEKKEWIELDNYDDPSDLTIEDLLLEKLKHIKLMQSKKWDCTFIICGIEGSGKSTIGFICGQYLSDMGLTLDNIANGSDDAIDKLRRLPDGSVLIVDEAELLFSSRETMTKEQKQLTKILMIIRQKRMVLILISPVFFDLSKYIAIDRSRFLIRTYTDQNLNRGFYGYWGTKKKMKLYHEGKKNHGQYYKPKANFYGKFIDYKLPFDDEYQKVKLATLMLAFEKDSEKKKRLKREEKEEEEKENKESS